MADDPIDQLYGLPLEEFVAARDALAKEARAGGDRERAAAIKRLAKPTRAAWAVNQLARSHADEVRALVDAGAALAGAQEELLGGAEPGVLRQAAEAARALVDALAAQAPVDGATRDKVRATLHAATVDAEARAEVASGRVLKERAASGFGGLDGLVGSGAAATAAAAPAAPPGPDPREVRRRRDALRRANEAEAEAESAVDGARRSLEQVEATVAARRRELEEARTALAEARDRRERAERAAAELS
ncbi:MAG TPA: hypothetical protein VFG42_07035 [Baekduia sp.]|uniref:hypothetical protein n=1 Tax=Baekduia sp. TaxID=2600305 RepID=UPI002D7A3D8E|nr:hypothetical protein [Baekduia sp.]HET6506524.1 hypothetical protein [Baekduia sp.]